MLTKALAGGATLRRFIVSAGILAAAAPGAAQAGATVFTPTGSGATGGSQTYVVPATGIYDITAFGAEGGVSFGNSVGGLGAEIGGNLALTAGETLTILVGQAGSTGFGGGAAGGGGGTFVVFGNPGNFTPLVIAGGGGGGGSHPIGGTGGNGSTGNNGGNGGGLFSGAGGFGGGGGGGAGFPDAVGGGGGGGGFNGAGGDGQGGVGNGAGLGGGGFIGGQGGAGVCLGGMVPLAGAGGYGGGGSGGCFSFQTFLEGGGGGGGGYSGGGGGDGTSVNGGNGGGGGGSYLASFATNPVFGVSDIIGGAGQVDITLLQSPAPMPGAGLLSLALLMFMGAASRASRLWRRG